MAGICFFCNSASAASTFTRPDPTTRRDQLLPLCRCTWGALTDTKGNPVKSEFLHPNPNWSPDGRYVIFGTDYGTLLPQLYLADLSTRKEP